MSQQVLSCVWIPLSEPPEQTGKYLVGHRGHHEMMYYFTDDREWHPGTKLGWQRNVREKLPKDFNATHWMRIPDCPRL